MIKNGYSFTYLGELSSHDQPALAPRNNPEPPMGMSLYLSNGRGAYLEENFTFNNIQPDTPDFSFDSNSSGGYNGGLAVNIFDASEIRIYEGNVSDVSGDNTRIWEETLGADSGTHHLHLLDGGVLGSSTITYGTPSRPYYDLRVIGQGDNALHSDMRRVLYVPLYKGTHMLSSNALGVASDTNATPIAFSYTGESYDWVYDNSGLPTDGGVQLELAPGEHNASDSNTTILVYKPVAGSQMSGCTIRTADLYDGEYLARVGYCPAYDDSVFYFYHKERDRLYYGIFPTASGSVNLEEIDTNQTIENFHIIPPL